VQLNFIFTNIINEDIEDLIIIDWLSHSDTYSVHAVYTGRNLSLPPCLRQGSSIGSSSTKQHHFFALVVVCQLSFHHYGCSETGIFSFQTRAHFPAIYSGIQDLETWVFLANPGSIWIKGHLYARFHPGSDKQ